MFRPTFDCLRCRFGVAPTAGRADALLIIGVDTGLGGAAAMATTVPLALGTATVAPWLVGVLPAVDPPLPEP